MHEAFDEEEFEPVPQRRDTELTLGSFMLLGLFLGLALLCGLFFGLGYAVGHRGAAATQAAAPQPEAVVPNPLSAEAPHPKPSASPQSASAQSQAEIYPLAPTGDANPEAESSTVAPAVNDSASQRIVHPALPLQSAPQPAGGVQVQRALAGALMVQIAAISHSEDAEVLVAALRRRGYAVTMSRDAADSLLHVRIGPFFNRNEASAMRDKLLNDGYNAMVQP
jgi:DedD protein